MALTAEPFEINVDQSVLDDVRARLVHTAYPVDMGNDDWRYGVPRAYLTEIVDYWTDRYDWRAHEREMNAWPNFRTQLDGLPIHFVHVRGAGPDPCP